MTEEQLRKRAEELSFHDIEDQPQIGSCGDGDPISWIAGHQHATYLRLLDAVETLKYGTHRVECMEVRGDGPCTCGWTEHERKIKELLGIKIDQHGQENSTIETDRT